MKKSLIILLAILFIGSGYVVYDTIQSNKAKEADLADLQAQIKELNAQVGGIQETGTIEEDIIPAPEVVEEDLIPAPEVVEEYIMPAPEVVEEEKEKPAQATRASNTGWTAPQPTTITPQKLGTLEINTSCDYWNNEGLPTTSRGKDAKFINGKLQYVRDHGQNHTRTIVDEAYSILSTNITERCRQSWLIDELSDQKGYVRSYNTENGVTTIGIDFISLQDDISKIKWDGPPWLDLYKNTSTKVRYYTLSSNPSLESLWLDSNKSVVINSTERDGLQKIYINNFSQWINQFCNNEPIYFEQEAINYNYSMWERNFNENNMNCITKHIENGKLFIFKFDSIGNIRSIKGGHRFWSVGSAG